ncbi:MAG: family transcriptional regulator, cyclic receptor protein [Frankiaceae bacterium]|jgi:CRP-like cAMP-binding protein|nr:family transcriptional regulator, cyclic receptor protein [Frankiaceae bacterium]
MSQSLRAAVAASPLLSAARPSDVRELVKRGRETTIPSGWTFVHEETPADACYLIIEGTAAVVSGGKTVATLTAGDVVGEVALARTALRNASVVSRTRMRLLHIDAAAFAELSPRLRDALLRDVTGRLVSTTPGHSPATR